MIIHSNTSQNDTVSSLFERREFNSTNIFIYIQECTYEYHKKKLFKICIDELTNFNFTWAVNAQ